MKTIAYASPFIPPEWIAAHGLRPMWLAPRPGDYQRSGGSGRGVCPYAGAVAEAVSAGIRADAVAVATACDQMRYAAAVIDQQGSLPIFLMNVPSTWQTQTAAGMYLDELKRLGRFLVRQGGRPPDVQTLIQTILAYDQSRTSVRSAGARMPARLFARAVMEVRAQAGPPLELNTSLELNTNNGATELVPLALVGGPLPEKDYAIFDVVEQSGGRVVLDATETGERTLPAAIQRPHFEQDPLEALAEAYFLGIPDIFRRPNDQLYDWLGQQMTDRQVRGVLLRRYLWCDLWHAEIDRMRRWSPVPVLEIDVCEDGSAMSRTRGRVEAFLETLRT